MKTLNCNVTSVLPYCMNWKCKIWHFTTSKQLNLLKHYRLQHWHFGRNQAILCLHSDCPCTFRTWGALRTHLSRCHPQLTKPGQLLSFAYLVCKCYFHTEQRYYEHLGGHLKKCPVFFKIVIIRQIYTQHSKVIRAGNIFTIQWKILKMSVFHNYQSQTHEESQFFETENYCGSVLEKDEDSNSAIIQRLGLLLLKLECFFNVSKECIDV